MDIPSHHSSNILPQSKIIIASPSIAEGSKGTDVYLGACWRSDIIRKHLTYGISSSQSACGIDFILLDLWTRKPGARKIW